eukprot:gene22410-28534_t
MEIDWDSVTKDEISRLKDSIASLLIQATVPEETAPVDFSDRHKLVYGKIYLHDSVQSYDYSLASFGRIPPIGKQQLVLLPNEYGCGKSENYADQDYSGKTLLIKRGECTFLVKAQNAKAMNAAGLVVVNTEDRLESPSSGLGVDKNITDAMVLPLNSLHVVSVSNTSWIKLTKALEFNSPSATYVSLVPLKCHSGGSCAPVVAEERALQSEVSWGSVRTTSADREVRSFEFLTSNFGAQLPSESQPVSLVLSDPIDACAPLLGPVEQYANAAVVVHRGKCRFDVKALHAQNAGARMLIIIDVEDNALQRVGGMQPESGFVGIPSVIVTAMAGQYIQSQLVKGELHAEFSAARDSSVADAWIDLSMTQWNEIESERLLQLEGLVQKHSSGSGAGSASIEIVPWLQRRVEEITFARKKSIDTDEL